jgi:hypothetical protein
VELWRAGMYKGRHFYVNSVLDIKSVIRFSIQYDILPLVLFTAVSAFLPTALRVSCTEVENYNYINTLYYGSLHPLLFIHFRYSEKRQAYEVEVPVPPCSETM